MAVFDGLLDEFALFPYQFSAEQVLQHYSYLDKMDRLVLGAGFASLVSLNADCSASGTLCCSVLQCVAVCCSVSQCVAVCCSVVQRVATILPVSCHISHISISNTLQHIATQCSTLQHALKHCNPLQPTAHGYSHGVHPQDIKGTILQRAAARCNTLQHTATHCA